MLSDDIAIPRSNVAGLCRKILLQEVAKATFSDETDAGAVFFSRVIKTRVGRYLSNDMLVHITDGEQRLAESLMTDLMQEVALVLITICAFEQPRFVLCTIGLHVVASRDQVGPELHGIIEKGPEFNLTVA